MRYDIAVVGSGPAGLTAAVYARRAGKSVLVLEKETFGGQIALSPCLENYPSIQRISGAEFAENLLEQAQNLGAEFEMDLITGLEQTENGFSLLGEAGRYEARAVILAVGARHRKLGLPKEDTLRGVCYCAVCDGAFYKDREVAVAGGGNSALQDALLLGGICSKVTILQDLETLTGDKILRERLSALPNVSVITGAKLRALEGEGELTGVTYEVSGQVKTLPCAAVFVAVGMVPCAGAFTGLAAADEQGYLQAGEDCATGVPGLFAAGDCRVKTLRQVVTATADGAQAALAACRFLEH